MGTSTKPLAFVETASISSGSDGKNIPEVINSFQNQGGYGQVDYLAKSNPVSRPPPTNPPQTPNVPSVTQLQSINEASKTYNSYQTSAQQPVPTKDSFEHSQLNQFASSTSSYQQKTISPAPVPKPASSYASTFDQDLIYKPQVENSAFSQNYQIPSATAPSAKLDAF